CGSNQLEYRIPKGDNRPRQVCSNCHMIHYSNPKIVAGCLPIWENQVLLCKRAIEPCRGLWNVPAGYLENGETAEEGAIREVWEEAEAKVDILGVLAVYSLPHVNQVYIHFLAKLQSLDFGVGVESLDTQLFLEKDVPWDTIAFTSSSFALKKYFKDRQNGLQQAHIGAYSFNKK
ncbi:MAG: NUDIX hydrolase, partial [Bacteroidota bacterium]